MAVATVARRYGPGSIAFPDSGRSEGSGERIAPLDFAAVHAQFKCKGETLQLLWEKYRAAQREVSYSYFQFCSLYREFRGGLQCGMRKTYLAGEKLFVDFCGPTVDVINVATAEVHAAQIFVAA